MYTLDLRGPIQHWNKYSKIEIHALLLEFWRRPKHKIFQKKSTVDGFALKSKNPSLTLYTRLHQSCRFWMLNKRKQTVRFAASMYTSHDFKNIITQALTCIYLYIKYTFKLIQRFIFIYKITKYIYVCIPTKTK